MKVINLVPWADRTFSLEPGDEVDLPDDVARAREAAGLVSFIHAATPITPAAPKRPANQKR